VNSRRLANRIITPCSNDTQYEANIAYRKLWGTQRIVLLLTLLSLCGAGCSEQATPYRPPTIVVQVTRPLQASTTPTTTSKVAVTPFPISTPACTDNLTFLEDLSLPDGTVVKPGAPLDKRWLVENSGSCNWDEKYRLKFMSGAELSAPLDQALYPARSASSATIRIIFTAPSEPGTYQSAWQAYNPQGEPFGNPVFMQVTVGSDQP
jgi:hypothetical protein